ncbi:MAG: RAMP superfamily CRISPR-associated protein [Mycobacterium sp.]
MSLASIQFDIDILAQSSIVHREEYTSQGTDNFALFRREKIITATGEVTQVPIISGSNFRGILRRIGESLTAGVLDYEDNALPLPAAHLLTNGGRLAKSARPLTDEQERRLKTLLPVIAVFGGAASNRIMSGLLTVGKVLPEIAELAHILPRPPQSTPLPAVLSLAGEHFTHLSDHRPTTSQAPTVDAGENDSSPLGRFGIETLPAGTRLQTWVRITNATGAQVAFLCDVLTQFATYGHLGGRIAAGHGQITATVTATALRGTLPMELTTPTEIAQALLLGTTDSSGRDSSNWAADLAAHRDEAIAALTELT